MELYIECKGDKYILYKNLQRYFDIELLEDDKNTMGFGDFKILIEPVTKSIETLGNIIISIINIKKCVITVKNGEKKISFEGNPGSLDNQEVIDLLKKVLEV